MEFTEGHATGIPKIIRAMWKNGLPLAEFDFDEDHSYFIVRLPIHPAALEVAAPVAGEKAIANRDQVRTKSFCRNEALRREGSANIAMKKAGKPHGYWPAGWDRGVRIGVREGGVRRQGWSAGEAPALPDSDILVFPRQRNSG